MRALQITVAVNFLFEGVSVSSHISVSIFRRILYETDGDEGHGQRGSGGVAAVQLGWKY